MTTGRINQVAFVPMDHKRSRVWAGFDAMQRVYEPQEEAFDLHTTLYQPTDSTVVCIIREPNIDLNRSTVTSQLLRVICEEKTRDLFASLF